MKMEYDIVAKDEAFDLTVIADSQRKALIIYNCISKREGQITRMIEPYDGEGLFRIRIHKDVNGNDIKHFSPDDLIAYRLDTNTQEFIGYYGNFEDVLNIIMDNGRNNETTFVNIGRQGNLIIKEKEKEMKQYLVSMMKRTVRCYNEIEDHFAKEFFRGKISAIEEIMNIEGMNVFVDYLNDISFNNIHAWYWSIDGKRNGEVL